MHGAASPIYRSPSHLLATGRDKGHIQPSSFVPLQLDDELLRNIVRTGALADFTRQPRAGAVSLEEHLLPFRCPIYRVRHFCRCESRSALNDEVER